MPLPDRSANLPKGNPLDGPPPLPPKAPPAAAQNATYQKLVPPAGAPAAGAPPGMAPSTPGGSQISEKIMQIGYEIEMALKTLAQQVPQLGPWVMQVVPELRTQLGQALTSGMATNPTPVDNQQMPDGSGRL